MKALYIRKPWVVETGELAKPEPGPGEVLLRVQLVGLCASDLSTYRGKNQDVEFPRIPGHEVAASIEDAAPDVPASFTAGMKVTLRPYTACGECPACRRGRLNACRANRTLGVQRDGAMAEYMVSHWQALVPAPGLSFQELCLVEPLAVGFHAIARGCVTARDTVAVIGSGAVGLGAVAGAAFRGARVIAVDVDACKLRVARKAGAAETINPVEERVAERITELTDGQGPDVVVEAVGLPQTYRSAIETVTYAGRVVYIGYAKEQVEYDTRLFVHKELDILGSRNSTQEDFEEVIRMLGAGTFPVEDVISKVCHVDETPTAFSDWNRNPGAFTKIVVDVGDSKARRQTEPGHRPIAVRSEAEDDEDQ